MTTIYLCKGNLSVELDLDSYHNFEALSQTLADFLYFDEIDSRAQSFLCYYIEQHKYMIRNETDYLHFLKKQQEYKDLELHQEEKKIEVLKSFAENAARLISTYKKPAKEPKEVEKEEGDQQPQESWVKGNWINWAELNVAKEKQEDFRYEIEKMFDYEELQTVSYSLYDMNDDLLRELESHQLQAQRYDHSESGVSCILFSIYNQIAQDLGIKHEQKDPSLWKLCAWKEQNVQIKQKGSVKNFHVTHQSRVIIPVIKSSSQENKRNRRQNLSKSGSFFSKQPLTKEQQKEKYQILDQIHYTTSRFLRNQYTEQQFLSSNRILSDDQVWKFVQEVGKAKLQYFQNYVHKVPSNAQDGVLKPFADNQKIGILGDWGSGLPDSFDLLDELVLQRGATVILHLGDVYYAGFPNEFKVLSDKIKQLRTKVPTLRYYTIPGNHDFYTNGGPFYDSLNNYNDNPELKQKFGFFCLRNVSNTVQYIGLDTGYSDSGAFNEIDAWFKGAFVYPEELAWAIQKINNFGGQTILLTHHQAFSPYDKILGNQTRFGWYDQQSNNKLCEQLFQVLPKVSVWYWGHEHRLSFFKPNAYGIPCSRTLGNSAFQVHDPETYVVKYKEFDVTIPYYNPARNDKQDPQKPYYDHTGAVVSFSQDIINVEYVDMTSSYYQKSVSTRRFDEKIKRPLHSIVETNKVYRIKDTSSLSYCYNDSAGGRYMWIHYQPYDLIFENANDPNYAGPVTSGMQLYIRVVASKQYFYLSYNSYVKTYPSKDSSVGKFKFYNRNGQSSISTGDNLTLVNIYKGRDYTIGRYYFLMDPLRGYYCLATGSGTEYTPCQIYDPNEINTDLKQ